MCGPFIHGRTLIHEGRQIHHCYPMTANSHSELPDKVETYVRAVASLGVAEALGLVVEAPVEDVPAQTSCMGLVVPNRRDGNFATDNAGLYIGKGLADLQRAMELVRDPVTDARARAFPEGHVPNLDPATFETVEAQAEKIIDWGLQPWDGKWVPQIKQPPFHPISPTLLPPNISATADTDLESTLATATMEGEIAKLEALYMPRTQKDLIEWARGHWGKRGDNGEFCQEMIRCLDDGRLYHSFPLDGMDKRSGHYRVKARQHLLESNRSAETWAGMFREAPNKFWRERERVAVEAPEETVPA